MQRGKFRPSLTKLIQSNAADAVVNASKDAFQKLRTSDVGAAIKALSVLRGVGPATASGTFSPTRCRLHDRHFSCIAPLHVSYSKTRKNYYNQKSSAI